MYPKTVLILGVALASMAPSALADIAFVNVNLIPMTSERVLPARTVIVSANRITEIGEVADVRIPDGIEVVDGTDRYLMPGLSEMHAHVPGSDGPSLQRTLNLYVVNGITLARGMLGQPSHLDLRQRIAAGEVLGPRLYTSGPSFNGRSVTSPEQARQMVAEQAAAGYDFLKIHPGLTREEFDAMAEAANEAGIRFAGHVPADVGIHRALAAGIATIDHLDGYMQALIPANDDPTGGFDGFFGVFLAPQASVAKIGEIVALTREAGTANVPTQSLFEHVVNTTPAADMKLWPEMRYMPEATVERWISAKNEALADPNYSAETADLAIKIRRELILRLHKDGAELLLGSDSPQIFNVPGFAIHRELQYLVDAGLTPFEALRTGTVHPAEFFGRGDDWGTVEVGKEADLVLLDENPLVDISATRRVHGVMLQGRWLSQMKIRELLESAKR